MTCPKCGAPMRTHRRNGVTIEQCTKCHGMFLDAGELEQLLSAERLRPAQLPAYGSTRNAERVGFDDL